MSEYPHIQEMIDAGEYRPKFAESPFLHVADLVDKETGKTYREKNAELTHNIPIGALVELHSGVRLFVVVHGRDCDNEPLYWLSPRYDDREDGIFNKRVGGYSENSLKVIRLTSTDEELEE